jgi:hypothetical protein
VQLGLDPQYPRLGLLRRGPRRAGIHRRPPGLPVSLPRTRCRPWPCGRLSRPLTTTAAPSPPRTLSRRRACRHRPGGPVGRAVLGAFPRSPHTGRRGRCPAIPLQPRHGYAAAFPRGLPNGTRNRLRSRPPIPRPPWVLVGRALLPGPDPPDFEPVSLLRGFHHWFLQHVHLPVSLAGPGPSGSADPSRRCRGCSPLPCASRVRLPPASATCCDRPPAGSSLPPGHVAPRGARES